MYLAQSLNIFHPTISARWPSERNMLQDQKVVGSNPASASVLRLWARCFIPSCFTPPITIGNYYSGNHDRNWLKVLAQKLRTQLSRNNTDVSLATEWLSKCADIMVKRTWNHQHLFILFSLLSYYLKKVLLEDCCSSGSSPWTPTGLLLVPGWREGVV